MSLFHNKRSCLDTFEQYSLKQTMALSTELFQRSTKQYIYRGYLMIYMQSSINGERPLLPLSKSKGKVCIQALSGPLSKQGP